MHSFKILYLLGMCNVFAYALTIPQVQNGGALVRRVDWSPELSVPDDLHKRATPQPAPVKPAPVKSAPVKPAKPAPGLPVRPAPARPGKSAQPPAQATPKISPAPAGKPIVWPAVKIPYATTAIDTCGIFVNCDEPGADVGRLEARAVTITHTAHAALIPAPTPPLVRRDIRTYVPSAAKVTIKNLDYPSAPDLFQGANGAKVKHNVFDFNAPEISDYKVKNLKKEPASYKGYVTEHIIELQTIKVFIDYAVTQESKLKAFFENLWNKDLAAADVASRPNKPQIPMGTRSTLNNLVFEALGSNFNREDFVICEEEINGYKARIWKTLSPMDNYKNTVTSALKGEIDSNVYLSGLRNTLAVFEYMNEAEVKKRLQASVKNVGIELQNVKYFTKETTDLAKLWYAFIEKHLTDVENTAKTWLNDRIEKETEKEIANMITTLKELEADLKKKENSKNKATHEKKAKEASDKLDKEIKTAKDAVATQETVLKNAETDLETKRDASTKKKTELKDEEAKLTAVIEQIAAKKDKKKLADLNTEKTTLEGQIAQIKAEKSTADNAREKAQRERKKAKRALLTKKKAVGRKQRAKWSLRSEWLAKVIADLKKDQVVVAEFKKAAGTVAMPKPV